MTQVFFELRRSFSCAETNILTDKCDTRTFQRKCIASVCETSAKQTARFILQRGINELRSNITSIGCSFAAIEACNAGMLWRERRSTSERSAAGRLASTRCCFPLTKSYLMTPKQENDGLLSKIALFHCFRFL